MANPSGGNGEDALMNGGGHDIYFGVAGSPSGDAGSEPDVVEIVEDADSGTTLDLTDVIDFLAGPTSDASGILHLAGTEIQPADGAIPIFDATAIFMLDENGNLTVSS